MHETQDNLFNLQTRAESDKLRFTQGFKNMPRLSPEENLQVERMLEWQPGMPQVPAPSTRATEMIDKVIKPAQRRAAQNLAWLKGQDAIPEDLLDQFSEGYLHRIAVSPRRPIGNEPFAPFQGVVSASAGELAERSSILCAAQSARRPGVRAPGAG
jgi:hypothetical protein